MTRRHRYRDAITNAIAIAQDNPIHGRENSAPTQNDSVTIDVITIVTARRMRRNSSAAVNRWIE